MEMGRLFILAVMYLVVVSVNGKTMHQRRNRVKRPKERPLFNQILAKEPGESEFCLHDLCSNVSSYPSDYVKKAVMKRKDLHGYFGKVIEPYHFPTLLAKSYIDKEAQERNMCETVQFTYYPQSALNRNRRKMTIVNIDNFKQAVAFEACIQNARCFLDDHKPLGYQTACKQQYNLIRLVSMEEDGNLVVDSFPVPSSCVCTYKRV